MTRDVTVAASSSGARGALVDPHVRGALVDSAVALVTSAFGGRRNAMTASMFAESSHLPVLVRVSISPATYTHELVERSGWFGLNVLAAGQEDIALACGHASGRTGCKFRRSGLAASTGASGLPLIEGALTASECRVVRRLPVGDHTLFVGEIVSSVRQTRISYRDPLLLSDLRRLEDSKEPVWPHDDARA